MIVLVVMLFNMASAIFQLFLRREQDYWPLWINLRTSSCMCVCVHSGWLFGKVLAHQVSMPQISIPLPNFIVPASCEPVNTLSSLCRAPGEEAVSQILSHMYDLVLAGTHDLPLLRRTLYLSHRDSLYQVINIFFYLCWMFC